MGALIRICQADPDVQRLVADRVYGGELDPMLNKSMPVASVVIRRSGGGALGPGARSYVPWRVQRTDFLCFGKTPREAGEVEDAIYQLIIQLTTTKVDNILVKSAVHSGGPLDNRDPDTDWPFVIDVFDVSTTPIA